MRNRPAVTPAVGETITAAMSSESVGDSAATRSIRRRAVASSPSSSSSSASRSRPRMPSSVRASISPSVNRQATEPGTSGTVVWRSPVRTPTPIGGEERRGNGLVRLRSDHDRRRVPGGRVRQRTRFRVVHGEQNGGEVSAQVVVDHAAGHLERHARLEAGLEVGAQRVAHEGGAGERAAAVAGHVAEDEADAAARQRQHVVEVAARAGAVGRPVGHRRAQRADLVRAPAAAARSGAGRPPGAARGAGGRAAARAARRGGSRSRAGSRARPARPARP